MVRSVPRVYKIVKESNVPAKMRDGVTLYADVYRPDAPGRFPVLLMRTPYNKAGFADLPEGLPRELNYVRDYAERFVPRGYVLVVQDTRSRFTSEGDLHYYPLIHEANDGYDTVEWAAQLPWANGRVGTVGQSYMGATQYLLAPTRPPHLRAMVPVSAPSDWHESWVYRTGGALEWGWLISYVLLMVPGQLERQGLSKRWPEFAQYLRDPHGSMGELIAEAYSHLPLADWGERFQEVAPYVQDYLTHPEDGPYWWRLNLRRRFQEVNVPMYHVTSWYDGFLEGALHAFVGIREYGQTEQARAAQKLLIGPWSHLYVYTAPTTGMTGEIDFGPEAAIGLHEIEQRWFDYWLKGIETGISHEPPVLLFVMGENVWREENEWPLARTRYTPYYLHSGGSANTLRGDGTLSEVPPQQEPPDSYVYDPHDPVPTRGGNSCLNPLTSLVGVYDQREVEARQDVLVYTSQPLAQDLEVTGPVVVKLYAASTAPDTDFTAKLVDVRPDGYAQNLQSGIVRARYRRSQTNPAPLTPGEVTEFTIDLWATSQVFKAGHCIRVEISSSNFPLWDRNPNTGGPVALATAAVLQTAKQTIFHDAQYPSHIVLPLIPR
jgi:uncharacterized protein